MSFALKRVDRPAEADQLPFATCQVWGERMLILFGQPYRITCSFSWAEHAESGWLYANSVNLICPRCQKQWAQILLDHDEAKGLLWPTPAFCGECGPSTSPRFKPAGSLFQHYFDLPLLYALPPDILWREFVLHINHEERQEV